MSNTASQKRNIKDAKLVMTVVNPTATTATSNSIDIGASDFKEEFMEIQVDIPAIAALADTKTLTISFEHSDDDSSFAAMTNLGSLVATGAGGAGTAAKTARFRLPSGTKRYVRISAVAVASSGTLTGSTTATPCF